MSLDIQPMREFDSSTLLGYWCKGHVDAHQFADEAELEWGAEIPAAKVEHSVARLVPSPEGQLLYYPQRSGRGAFLITVWEK